MVLSEVQQNLEDFGGKAEHLLKAVEGFGVLGVLPGQMEVSTLRTGVRPRR